MQKIIHLDADSFFASVEMRDRPELRRVPLAIGGDPGKRGVIATCNYEARKYGVGSAMASAQAKRLCPDLVILKPDMTKYRSISRQMMDIFNEYTYQIEPLSLDEAFLDVSESEKCSGSATLIAKEIRDRINKELGITVSAGVAPIKFLAKIASDWNKPNGLFVISPGEERAFISDLPVALLPGVGPVMRNKLARLGINTCKDVLAWDLNSAVLTFGSFGERIYQMCLGVDNRQVKPRSQRKSISVETTYEKDISSPDELKSKLPILIERLRLRVPDQAQFSGQFIKIKFNDFTLCTKESSIGVSNSLYSSDNFERLMFSAWAAQQRPVRLLGVGLRLADEASLGQLSFPFN